MLLLLALLAQLPSQAQLESALREAISATCPGSRVRLDADLTRACQDYVAATASGRIPPSPDAAGFYASLQSYEPTTVAGVASVSQAAGADRAVAELFSPSCHFNRAGVAAATDRKGEASVCVLVAQRTADLDPIPGRVRPGDTVKVSGTLGEGLSKPRIFVTRPNGEVEEIALESERLLAIVPLREKGEHSIEVLAESANGPHVVALRRVFAGVAPPDRPPRAATSGGTGLEQVAADIARLRAAHGLPQLRRDPELDEVAKGHSEEMARAHTLAHILPADGSPGNRLDAKGWAYSIVGENLGFAPDAVIAHEGIAQSPAHLSNLLNPKHRSLGLGLARGANVDGAEGVYLTEVLAAPVVGVKDPTAAVAKELAKQRAQLGLPPLQRDKMLDYFAGKEVRTAALHDDPRPRPALTGEVIQQKQDLETVVAEVYVASAPADVARSKNAAEPRWTRLGVGAIYASSKRYGPGRLWVVLIYAR